MDLASIKITNAAFILTMNHEREIIRDGTILISGNRITAITSDDTLELTPAQTTIDASDMVVVPGLCNGHIHVSYAHAVRGLFPDSLTREEYVSYVFRLQAEMTEEEEYYTSLLAITELLKYGTTCILDPGSTKFLDVCLNAYEQSGVRAVVGTHVLDRHTNIPLPMRRTDDAIRVMEDCITRYNGKCDGRVHAWAMPFSARLASKELLTAAKALADKYSTGVTLHQNFAEPNILRFVEEFGHRPVVCLAEWGVLGPNVALAHLTGLDASEVSEIASTDTRGIVCPAAAMKLGEAFASRCPLPEMLSRKVAVGLGTDSANNANCIDTMRAMYLVALVFKDGRRDTSMISAETALEMGTCEGAKALGLGEEIGSLEVNKKADLVLFDTRRPEWRNLINPVNNLVYSADGRSVDTVIVDGRIVISGQRATFVDEDWLVGKVDKIGRRLRERTGISFAYPWPISWRGMSPKNVRPQALNTNGETK